MRPISFLPFILFGLPILEIAVFIVVGREIGVLPTLALVILSGLVGFSLLRTQGLDILRRIQAELDAGRMPGEALFHGALVVAAGLLLILPGFVSDIVGIALFLPPVRAAIWRALRRRVEVVVVETRAPRRDGYDRPVVDLDAEDYGRRDDGGPNTPPNTPWRRLPPN